MAGKKHDTNGPKSRATKPAKDATGESAWSRLKASARPLPETLKNRHHQAVSDKAKKITSSNASKAAAQAKAEIFAANPRADNISGNNFDANFDANSDANSGANRDMKLKASLKTAPKTVRQIGRPKPPPKIGLAQKAKRRLSRGHIEIEARLDLHGLTAAQAHRTLIGFVSSAIAQDKKWLLVITGKGLRGEGKLRRAFADWLSSPPLAGQIAEYGNAAPNHGGDGAFYLRLRAHAKP